ncbi:hypothetical protein OBBRIDRAFT_782092 [Obba rivulosa]|uniref:Copper-fist domain-containing protein n=1 Tax=Obba rivulosa TaxID=1052685 RepID=A0A8E2AMC8_9APHY|nr:hypothetical protein OBBRIDRAFT_782092 [Obba rivulosa]
MVFVGDKKYACESCIKGHRSSACKHTDRPLFEIKPKGRPVTQCEHCRELRKTKQVHVKCMCGGKDDAEGLSSSTKKGALKVSVSAAFPIGLPEALDASGPLQASSEGSDSDHSGHGSSRSCDCKDSGSCNCATSRVPKGKRRGKARERPASPSKQDNSMEPLVSQPGGLVASAHGRGVRPVLPKPPSQQRSPPPTTSLGHEPSSSTRPHGARSEIHSPTHFSPYGRAYEYSHGAESAQSTQFPITPAPSPADDILNSNAAPWIPPLNVQTPGGSTLFPSLCGCGTGCTCPGCLVHRGPNADPSAAAQCMNPGSCPTCIDCALFPNPDALPTDFMDAAQIEEWLRQAAMPGSSYPGTLSPVQNQTQYSQPIPQSLSQPTVPPPFDPSLLQTYALWNALQEQVQGQGQGQPSMSVMPASSECCGGRCGCAPGFCSCGESAGDDDMRSALGFAVSGERASCCADAPRALSSSAGAQAEVMLDEQWALDTGVDTEGSFLGVPRANISRASSFSSGSSGHYSHASSPVSFENAGVALTYAEAQFQGDQAMDGEEGDVNAGVSSCSTSMRTMQMGPNYPTSR